MLILPSESSRSSMMILRVSLLVLLWDKRCCHSFSCVRGFQVIGVQALQSKNVSPKGGRLCRCSVCQGTSILFESTGCICGIQNPNSMDSMVGVFYVGPTYHRRTQVWKGPWLCVTGVSTIRYGLNRKDLISTDSMRIIHDEALKLTLFRC
jgi:hypothetical protein